MKAKLTTILVLTVIVTSTLYSSSALAASNEKTPVIVGFKELPDAALIHAFGGDISSEYSIIPAIACNLPTQAVNALQNNPKIAYVENDFEASALEYYYPTQDWGVTQIGAKSLFYSTPSVNGDGVKVAVIDTGVNWQHEDLDGNYVTGYDFVNRDNNPMDDNGHGTHCAGIIAAEVNGIAVAGVAPQASIYAYKVLNSRGSGTISNIILGIQQAKADQVNVISMSLGSTSYSQSLYDACLAATSGGIVVVAAAGNSGNTATGSTVNYPAKFDCVIAVGATNVNDDLASFSSTGPEVDVVAPGVDVLSDYKDVTPYDGFNRDTIYMSGTSMACPHVAGTVALMLQANPRLIPAQVQTILQNTALDLGKEGYDNFFGYGRIDAAAAVAQANNPPPPPVLLPMHIGSIVMGLRTVSRNTYATAAVTVLGANSQPVSGATVTGQWTITAGKTSTASGVTDATGRVTLQSSSVRNAQSGTIYTFTVNNVVKAGWIFQPGSDSGSITKP